MPWVPRKPWRYALTQKPDILSVPWLYHTTFEIQCGQNRWLYYGVRQATSLGSQGFREAGVYGGRDRKNELYWVQYGRSDHTSCFALFGRIPQEIFYFSDAQLSSLGFQQEWEQQCGVLRALGSKKVDQINSLKPANTDWSPVVRRNLSLQAVTDAMFRMVRIGHPVRLLRRQIRSVQLSPDPGRPR